MSVDWSKVRHPFGGYKVLAVYKYTGPQIELRLLMELEGDLWDLGYDDGSFLGLKHSREKMVELGWGPTMSSEPIWRAGEVEQKPVLTPTKAVTEPPKSPWKSEQHKRAYYGFKE